LRETFAAHHPGGVAQPLAGFQIDYGLTDRSRRAAI
jgi:hypothetical protein